MKKSDETLKSGWIYYKMWISFEPRKTAHSMTLKIGGTGRDFLVRSKEYQGPMVFQEDSVFVPDWKEYESWFINVLKIILDTAKFEYRLEGEHFIFEDVGKGKNNEIIPFFGLLWYGISSALHFVFKEAYPTPSQLLLFEPEDKS